MQLEPRTRVHEVRERHGVALGKAEVGEGGQLVHDLLGHLAGDAPLGHAGEEPFRQPGHTRPGAFGAHGLAQLVGFGGGESRRVDGDVHELFLEQRYPEGLLERPFEQRVRGVGGFEALAPPDVGVHRPSLDGTGPDDRHLDHEIGEAARPDAGQRGHLGPALHLEHPHGVGPAQHVVDGVLLVDQGQVDVLTVRERGSGRR